MLKGNMPSFKTGLALSFCLCTTGALGYDYAFNHDIAVERFYPFDMTEHDRHFVALSGATYTEHLLSRPISEGQLMSSHYFNEHALHSFEITTRSEWLSQMTGVRYVTSIKTTNPLENRSTQPLAPNEYIF